MNVAVVFVLSAETGELDKHDALVAHVPQTPTGDSPAGPAASGLLNQQGSPQLVAHAEEVVDIE